MLKSRSKIFLELTTKKISPIRPTIAKYFMFEIKASTKIDMEVV